MRTSSLARGFPLVVALGCGDSTGSSREDHGGASSSTGLETWGVTDAVSSTDSAGATGSVGAPSTGIASYEFESSGAASGGSSAGVGGSSEAEGSTSTPPSCPPQDDPCIENAVIKEECIVTALPDGTSCGRSACLQSCQQGVCQVASVDARTPVDELRSFALGGDLPEVFLGRDRFVFLDAGDREGLSSLSLVRAVDDRLQLVDQGPAWSLRPELASPWLWTPMYTGALAAIDDTHFVFAASNQGLSLYDIGGDALELRSEWPLYSDSPEVFDIVVLEDRVWTCGNQRLSEYSVAQEQLVWVRNVPLASICFYARPIGPDLLLLTSTGLFVASLGDEVRVTELLSGNFLDLAVGEGYVATRRVTNAAGYGDVEVYERDPLLAGESPAPAFVLPSAEVNAASVGVLGDALLVVENRPSAEDDRIEWWAQLYSLDGDFAPLGRYLLGADPDEPIPVARSSSSSQHAVIHPMRTVLEREGETLRKVTGPQQGNLVNLTSLDESTVVALSPTSYHRAEIGTDGTIGIVHGEQLEGSFYAKLAVLRSPHADPIVGPWPQQSETAQIPVVAPRTDGLELLGVWELAGGPAALDGAGGWIHRVAQLSENGATFRVERYSAEAVLSNPDPRTFELTLPFPPNLVQATDRGTPRAFTLDEGRSLLIAQQRSDGAAIDPSYGVVLGWFAMRDDEDPVLLASATWTDAGNLFAAGSEGDTLVVQTVSDVRIVRSDDRSLREIVRLGAQSQTPAEHLSYTLPRGATQSGLLYVAEQRIDEAGTHHGLVAYDIASLARVAAYDGFARPVVQVREVGDWLWLAGISHLWVAEPPCRNASSAQGN